MWATHWPPQPPPEDKMYQWVFKLASAGKELLCFSLSWFSKQPPLTWNSAWMTAIRKEWRWERHFTVYHGRSIGSTTWCYFPFKLKQTQVSCTVKFHVEIKLLENKIMIITFNPMIMATVIAKMPLMNQSCSTSLAPVWFSVPAQIIRLRKWLLNEFIEFIQLLESSAFFLAKHAEVPPQQAGKYSQKKQHSWQDKHRATDVPNHRAKPRGKILLDRFWHDVINLLLSAVRKKTIIPDYIAFGRRILQAIKKKKKKG